jgi:U4/U6 small nuclear ribonucleoprotein PRP4
MDIDTPVPPAPPQSETKPVVEGWGANRNTTAELPKSGLFLVTAGFDCNVRIWSADEWSLIRNLATDAGKVMSVDITGDGKFIASASYSRSFHLFGGDNSL